MGKTHGKTKVKPLSRPTAVFHKNAKKPEADDTPGKLRGARRKRLMSKAI